MIHTFGIRHHGPGSAKRLLKALRALEPDCLLVEAPADAEKQLLQITTEGLKPPVSILMYNPKDFAQASYLPFADFSPEWQAIKYALKKDIPIRAMDLPMGIQMMQRENQSMRLQLIKEQDPELQRMILDPLGYMAKIAGYEDSERWWEHTFEQEENDLAVFTGINEMMQALRTTVGHLDKSETLVREAHMRKVLRKAIKEGFENIAVVCGAWHSPAIENWQQYKTSHDNTVLRGLKKIKLTSCWIPWSYDRLAKYSGYGAGVISPAWYDLLFSRRKETTIRWMSRAARLFRKEGFDSSAAHVIEAVRLAESLASMRGLQVPGVEELEDAAVTTFSAGDKQPLQLIQERLVIGDVVGKVPIQLSNIPLQKDFEAQVKKARLTANYKSTETFNKELDFRKETQKRASILLHRLSILGIPWGTLKNLSGRDLGSFKEKWRLKWRPDYAIRIIQASMYGNTVEEAAHHWALEEAKSINDLAPLLDLLDQLQKAELDKAAQALIPMLQEKAAQSRDVLMLMAAVPSLVQILRYGSTRQLDKNSVQELLVALLPRIFIGLPVASRHLEEDLARDIFQQILSMQSSLSLLESKDFIQSWIECLALLQQTADVHPLLLGLSTRMLLENNHFSIDQSAKELQLALSKSEEPAVKALWLEGFLYGSAMLILYQPQLWNILDEWVKALAMEELYEILPLLRRTFTNFSASERQQLLKMAQGTILSTDEATQMEMDDARMDILIPQLVQLLNDNH